MVLAVEGGGEILMPFFIGNGTSLYSSLREVVGGRGDIISFTFGVIYSGLYNNYPVNFGIFSIQLKTSTSLGLPQLRALGSVAMSLPWLDLETVFIFEKHNVGVLAHSWHFTDGRPPLLES